MKQSVKWFARVLLAVMCFVLACAPAQAYPSDVRELLNRAPLYSQKTGYDPLDEMVAEVVDPIIARYDNTADRLYACYQWLIDNVEYERGYMYYVSGDFAVPDYAVYCAVTPFETGYGVCDNYNSAFTVMARYLGLDAFVLGGEINTGPHAWCHILLEGQWYIFDPQVADRFTDTFLQEQCFGRPLATSTTYFPESTDPADWMRGYYPACADMRSTDYAIALDGTSVTLPAYTYTDVDGGSTTYVKLRDVASLLSSTGAEFSVAYDDATKLISLATGGTYAPVGGELQGHSEGRRQGLYNRAELAIAGGAEPVSYVHSRVIDGYNYLPLRQLGALLDFNVSWDGAAQTVSIATDEPYSDLT